MNKVYKKNDYYIIEIYIDEDFYKGKVVIEYFEKNYGTFSEDIKDVFQILDTEKNSHSFSNEDNEFLFKIAKKELECFLYR